MVKIITEENESAVKDIGGVHNKYRWAWLQKTVVQGENRKKNTEDIVEKLADFISKVDESGKAQCNYCRDLINYGSRGCVASPLLPVSSA